MKILQVFDLTSPSGTSIFVNQLCNKLTEQGQQVTWLTTDWDKDQSIIKHPIYYNLQMLHCTSNFTNFYITPAIDNWCKEHLKTYDVIHLHVARSYQNLYLIKYARKFNIPYILDTHGSLPRGKGIKCLFKSIYDFYSSLTTNDIFYANAVIAENEFGKQEYLDFGIKEDKIKIIYPPLDINQFNNLPEYGLFRQKYNIKSPIVSYIGRINKIKGLDLLVEGFNELRKNISAKLVIIGNNDGYQKELKGLINKLSLTDQVIFTGFLSGKEKLEALIDSDVVCQVSKYEQGLYAPLDAIMCGTPIIVSNNSGAGIDAKVLKIGILCDYNKYDLARKTHDTIVFNQLIRNQRIPTEQQIIRDNLSFEVQIPKYISMYQEVISRNSQ